MTSLRRATFLSMAQRYVAFIIGLGTSMVLARLLSPAETGIYALAMAVVAVAQLLRDFGISEYVIQKEQISKDQLRSVLGASVLVAWAIAALLFAVAEPVARYYGEAEVGPVIRTLAINFMILPIGTTTFALLNREMAFKEIFVVQTASALVGSMVAMVLAFNGHSTLSLAWSAFSGTVTTIIALAVIRPAQTFTLPSFRGLAAIARFGGTLTIGRLADQVSRRAPDLLIAQFLGFGAVGIYSKSGSLTDAFHEFFTSGINRVATPAFAKHRRESTATGETFLRATELLVVAPFVFFGLLALLAAPLVRLLFGVQWMQVVTILQIGSIGGVLFGPYVLAPSVLIANGRIKDILRMQIVGCVLIVAAAALGAQFSLEVLVAAVSVAAAVKFGFMQWALYRCAAVGCVELLRRCRQSAFIAALAVLSASPALLLYDGTAGGSFLCLAVGGALAFAILVAGILVFDHPLAAEARRLFPSRFGAGHRSQVGTGVWAPSSMLP